MNTSSQLRSAASDVENASAGIIAAEKQLAAAHAQVEQAEANDVKAQDDLKRYKRLVEKQNVSEQTYDQAVAAAKASTATVAAGHANEAAAQQAVQQAKDRARPGRSEPPRRSDRAAASCIQLMLVLCAAVADVQQKRAALEQAELNLRYTKIVAPVSGEVNKTVVVGLNVQPGQQMLTVVPLEEVWITANFKETQLKRMRPGQRAEIKRGLQWPNLQGSRGQHRRGHGPGFQRASAGKCHRQLRQNRPADSSEDRARSGRKPRPAAPAGHERRTEGVFAMSDGTPDTPAVEAAPWQPKYNPWLIGVVVAMAAFMEVLDTSIANVALPYIGGGLGRQQRRQHLGAHLLSGFQCHCPPHQRLARRPLWPQAIFHGMPGNFHSEFPALRDGAEPFGSCCYSGSMQGAGGGGLQPMAQAILADSFPPEKRGLAFALYGITAVVAPTVGPTLGGWITFNYSWRWIFFINLPVGLADAVAGISLD